jgi:serine/threonine-protein kinase RsbW
VAVCRCIYRERFASALVNMGEVLSKAVAALYRQGCIEPNQEFAARLCMEEALVNAIKHGNKADPERKVSLEIAEEGDLCRIVVRDEGPGFDPESVMMPDCEQEGGRGICIIRHYMDHVEFDVAERSLIMLFRRKHLGKGAEPDE